MVQTIDESALPPQTTDDYRRMTAAALDRYFAGCGTTDPTPGPPPER
jgi:hypothetical protein